MALFGKAKDPHELLAKGKYKDAIQGFQEMLKKEPKNETLLIKLGDAYHAMGSTKECIPYYVSAAEIYAEKGFILKAVALEKKILKIDPSREDVLRHIAQMAQPKAAPAKAAVPSKAAPAAAPSAVKPPAPPPSPSSSAAPKPAPPPSPLEETKPLMSRQDVAPELDATAELDAALVADAAKEAEEETGASLPGFDDPPSPQTKTKKDAYTPHAKARVPLFSDFSPEEFAAFVKELRHHVLPAGSVVVREGTAGNSMYVISGGAVRVLTKDKNGEEVHLTDLVEGDFFGEVSLLKGVRRTATIVATEDAELLEITKDDLDRLSKKHPGILKTGENFYAERVKHTVETLMSREKGA